MRRQNTHCRKKRTELAEICRRLTGDRDATHVRRRLLPAPHAHFGQRITTTHERMKPVSIARSLASWVGLGTLVGVVSGSASALFLFLLDLATKTRESNAWLVLLLPLAGLIVGGIYEHFGKPIRAGSDTPIIDTLHDDGPEMPLRMAPMVLIGTVLTHLFGGSAGREGTAVQMGASLAADAISHRLGISPALRRQMLAAGVAGGFGSVFGTPIAGTVFGLKFVVLGKIKYDALLPSLVAAIVGDMTTRAWGIGHTEYPSPPSVALTPWLLVRWHVFALAIALTTVAFVELTHLIKKLGERYLPRLPDSYVVGGLVVVALSKIIGTNEYLGLGVPTMSRAFHDPSLPEYAFAAKLILRRSPSALAFSAVRSPHSFSWAQHSAACSLERSVSQSSSAPQSDSQAYLPPHRTLPLRCRSWLSSSWVRRPSLMPPSFVCSPICSRVTAAFIRRSDFFDARRAARPSRHRPHFATTKPALETRSNATFAMTSSCRFSA